MFCKTGLFLQPDYVAYIWIKKINSVLDTPFPTYPHGGRSSSNLSPLGEIRKGVKIKENLNFNIMEKDKKYLHRAIEIAHESIKIGGGPFGAIIVKDDKIITEASNKVVLNNDPTAHAEILAIRQAASLLNSYDLNGCILYSSCEPCPMCLGAIYWSGIKKVIYSCSRTEAEEAGFSDKLIYEEIMLDPSDRSISFARLIDPEAKEVFREWISTDDKIAY